MASRQGHVKSTLRGTDAVRVVVVCSFVLLLSALHLPKTGDLGSNPESATGYHSLLGFRVLLCKLVLADGGGMDPGIDF